MNALRYTCVVTALVISIGLAHQARADLEVMVTDGIHAPGTANDSATPGSASYSGTIGNFDVKITEGTGFPVIGSPSNPILDLTSLDITSAAGGTLTAEVTETGFTSTYAGEIFLSEITGVYVNSSATMNTYLDTTNADFGMGTPLSSGLFDNQSGTVSAPVVSGAYSLTEVITISANPSSLSSIDAGIIGAPEPSSLSMLAVALLALGWYLPSRRRAVVP